jgi:flagellin
MASQITLSAGVRSNLLNLQQTASLKETVQNRLSTGKKVNSALDNPTNFFTAAALTSRSSDLLSLLDGISNGIQTLKAADDGIKSITSSIESLQATVRQARQDKSFKNASYELDSATINAASSVLNLGITGGALGGSSVNIALNDQVAVTGGAFPAATLVAGDAGNITLQSSDLNGGNAVTVALVAGDTISTIVDKINTATGGKGIVASDDGTGKLKLVNANANAITIGGTAATLTATGLTAATTSTVSNGPAKSVDQIVDKINANATLSGKVRASNDSGKLRIENLSTLDLSIAGFNSSTSKFDGSSGTKTVGGNEVRQNLVTQFNDVRDQLDKLADDASFNGINLLRGDKLKLNFNETSTNSITIQSKDANGISSVTLGITAATVAEFGSDDQLDTRLEDLSNALSTLRSQASAFGSKLSIVQNRQDFTKALTTTLQVGADNLTLADTNEEGANLLALNTRQQLQTTSLSFASQADQAVLQFLR